MTGAGEMPTATTVAGILSGELGAGAGVEYMRFRAKLPFEGFPIDEAHKACARNRSENALRRPGTGWEPGRRGKCEPAAIQNDSLDAKILEDEPNPSGVGHLAAIVGHGDGRRIDAERPQRLIPVGGLVKSYVSRL